MGADGPCHGIATPADLADIEKVGTATHFNVHLRIGPAEKIDRKAKTLVAAIKVADKLDTTPGSKKPLIYAVGAT